MAAGINRVPFASLELGALLGSGATGEVFSGALRGAPVAVKRLKLASKDPNARVELSRRFRAEVDVLSKYVNAAYSINESTHTRLRPAC